MKSKERIYIAGCGGMLGEAFYSNFNSAYELKCTDIDVNENWIQYLDFRDYDSYKNDVSEFNPDFLIHLGAHTDLEYCELHPNDTFITNTLSVENAVHIANELNIPIVYISTAGIFHNKKQVYNDWDIPNPKGYYAKSKYYGELFVNENAIRSFVLRAGWMMGGGPKKDKKFIQKIMKQLKEGKTELHIVDDKMGTPTYTHDFANNTKLLLKNKCWGIYNMVCSGLTSRLEVATELISILGLKNEIKINVVNSDYFKKEYFAPRPASEQLINMKLELRGLNVMRNWKVATRDYIKNYYQDYL